MIIGLIALAIAGALCVEVFKQVRRGESAWYQAPLGAFLAIGNAGFGSAMIFAELALIR